MRVVDDGGLAQGQRALRLFGELFVEPGRGDASENRVAEKLHSLVRTAAAFSCITLMDERLLEEAGIAHSTDARETQQVPQAPPVRFAAHNARPGYSGRTLAKTMTLLCPPNPNEFESATRIGALRATFGT